MAPMFLEHSLASTGSAKNVTFWHLTWMTFGRDGYEWESPPLPIITRTNIFDILLERCLSYKKEYSVYFEKVRYSIICSSLVHMYVMHFTWRSHVNLIFRVKIPTLISTNQVSSLSRVHIITKAPKTQDFI